MYNRLAQGRKTLTDEFINGVNIFIETAKQLPSFISDGMFRCPCSKHKNQVHLRPDDIIVDLYRRGFMPQYWYWTSHGEYEPHFHSACGPSTSSNIAEDENITAYSPSQDPLYSQQISALQAELEQVRKAQTDWQVQIQAQIQMQMQVQQAQHNQLLDEMRKMKDQLSEKEVATGDDASTDSE
ncbi:hypothetical protein M5K25_000569 [Dendrobium thyrsiflorum]|uniref:Transposase-associated domain-containing protein n=1 Tax=Dendrobium thyrsiflorum TaxID=117978 RepID=A0ABD0VU93_DENTH